MPGAGSVGSLAGSDMPEEEPEEEQPTEGQEGGGEEKPTGFRDNLKNAYNEEKNKGKKGAKKAGKKTAGKAGKKLAEGAVKKGVEQAAGLAGAAALSAVLPVIGSALGKIAGQLLGKLLTDRRVHIALIIFLLLIILMIWAPAGGLALSYMEGGLTGGTPKVSTDLNNPEHVATINKIENFTKQTSAGGGTCGKRLEFADPEDLKLIKEGKVDHRILLAIERLTVKNDHLKISHVMNLMSKVPANTIETHSDVEKQYLDNESAHKVGMAFDVVEINCVYKYCICSQECGCDKIPVKVVWQSKGNLPGIARDAGLGKVTELLGLPNGALDGRDLNGVFESTGLAQLEQILNVAGNSLKQANDLITFLQRYGQAEMEKVFLLPMGSLPSQNSLSAYASETGRRALEQVLHLPYGSLTGSNGETVLKNTGQRSIEEELNVPWGWLTEHPNDALKYLRDLQLSQNQQQLTESYLGWTYGTIDNLFASLNKKDYSQVQKILIETGKDVQEQAFGVPRGSLDTDSGSPFSSQQGAAEDRKNNLPAGTLYQLFTSLKFGSSINPNMINVGGRRLDSALDLVGGSVSDVIYGRQTPEQAISRAERYGDYYNIYLSSRLNISVSEAKDLRMAILKGNNLTPQTMKIGTVQLERYFNLKSGSLTSLINGQISPEIFLQMNKAALNQLADSLKLPYQAISQLFNGNFINGLQEFGKSVIASTFGFNISQFMNWVNAGNIQAIIQNQVIQAVAAVLGINPAILGGILSGNINPSSLISLGVSILIGGPLGGIFGGVFGGLGGGCSTACYQPEAIKNIRLAISQLLDLGPNFKPTQIITYRQADVDYFDSRLDTLYGSERQPNYGLFAREEMLGHIHIGY
jgi:hypothetical protein